MSDLHDANYFGRFIEPVRSEKKRRKRYTHPIFLYDDQDMKPDRMIARLNQIVNIYEHTLEDFEFNSRKIIQHYVNNYGSSGSPALYTLGQNICFRVFEHQDPVSLPLFKFFVNYTLLIVPICMGVDMHDWQPFVPAKWTSGEWVDEMNKNIRQARSLGNARALGELIEWSKYLMNLFVAKAGDRLGLSISNNDFIEVAKRNRDAYESMTCTFQIPKGITPSELEDLTKKRTTQLLDIISEMRDLPISIYTRNGLFNPGQFREFAVHIGHKPDLYGNTIPFTANTNIMMGLKDPRAYVIDASGGRKAEIVKLNVSDAGALERALCMLMSGVRFVDTEYECDSQHFRTRHIDSLDVLGKLEGRVCTLDPKSDEYLIIDVDNTDLVGKTVYLKTPITCTHPKRSEGVICSACYGKLMANLNCDIHIGRLAALNSADDMEQKLLSAKHALATNTNDVKFDTTFDAYFDMDSCQIYFNQAMVDASEDDDPEGEFNHLFLEFHLGSMKKFQDGEGRHFDRAIPEIVIYDDRDDSRVVIREENGALIYLSVDLVDYFLEAAKHKDAKKGIARVPFNVLIDNGKVICDILFEYQYKNNEIAGALLELEGILTNGTNINAFDTYDECLDRIIPLFKKGGIHLPEFQQELLISQMIATPDRQPVDWTLEDPEYRFFTINKSIQNSPSVLTSVLYQESSRQIAGEYGAYSKAGTSAYDWFIMDN